MRVLEIFVMYKSHRAAHQVGRADRLAPRVVVRVARGDLKIVVRGEGVDLDAALNQNSSGSMRPIQEKPAARARPTQCDDATRCPAQCDGRASVVWAWPQAAKWRVLFNGS